MSFPANPTIGQQFTLGDRTYVWSGFVWNLQQNLSAGATGPQGPVGATGPVGQSGPSGATGVIGATGPAGATGAVGPQGATGPVGPAPVVTPHETDPDKIYVDGVAIVSVQGTTGPTGATGPAGPTPVVTPHETDSDKIYVGGVLIAAAQGATGPSGPVGLTGATGPEGPTGVAGPMGATGPAGQTGPAGAAGTNGVTGATGVQGPAGLGGTTTSTTLAYAPTIETDAAAADIFNVVLTGNATLANPANPSDGKTIRWRLRQDANGNHAITLGDKFNISSSSLSPLPFSTAANKLDMLAATYDAARDKWDVVAFVYGY